MSKYVESAAELIGKTPLLKLNGYTKKAGVTDFYHPGDEGGLAWNDPSIGIEWPQLVGEYPGNADPSGYKLEDGTPLNFSEKDTKWDTLENTFKFK